MPYPEEYLDWESMPPGFNAPTSKFLRGVQYTPPVTVPPPSFLTKQARKFAEDRAAAKAAVDELAKGKIAPTTLGTSIPLPSGFLQTWTDGSGNVWSWDPGQGQYVQAGYDPTKVYQKPKEPPTTYPREEGQPETWTDNSGVIWSYDVDTNDYIKIGYDPTKDTSQQITPYQQADITAQQESLAWSKSQEAGRLAAEKEQRLATLRASPASWLEYASLAGTTPAIQPWMLPLMPQQYQGTQAGASLPGWQATGQSLSTLPALTSPSRQYQARMGPSAQQQYYGYEQARTGATPEDVQWRLWSQAPPSGQFGGLNWKR